MTVQRISVNVILFAHILHYSAEGVFMFKIYKADAERLTSGSPPILNH